MLFCTGLLLGAGVVLIIVQTRLDLVPTDRSICFTSILSEKGRNIFIAGLSQMYFAAVPEWIIARRGILQLFS